jgi:hypothetical protein
MINTNNPRFMAQSLPLSLGFGQLDQASVKQRGRVAKLQSSSGVCLEVFLFCAKMRTADLEMNGLAA